MLKGTQDKAEPESL